MKKRKNHSADFKARAAPDAIREEMTPAELSKKCGVHANQITTWKRAAIRNMATAFTKRGSAPEQVSAAEVEKLRSRTGQLVAERDFLADASVQRPGMRGKNGEQHLTLEIHDFRQRQMIRTFRETLYRTDHGFLCDICSTHLSNKRKGWRHHWLRPSQF